MANSACRPIYKMIRRQAWRSFCTVEAKRPVQPVVDESQPLHVDAKARRKKVALLVGYSGQGYHSFQLKMGSMSIEDRLLTALQKAKLASQEECQNSQSIFLECGAKTGKDVSAVKQIVSLLLSTDAGVLEKLNSHLPPEIRVFGMRQLAPEVDSSLIRDPDFCTYSYLLPTFYLSPFGLENKSFRASPQLIEKFRETLKLFEGTKNFHNFLRRSKFDDPDSERHISQFDCLEPFELGGLQFVECQVKAKIFKKDQIRRMVAFAFAGVKSIVKPNLFTEAFSPLKLNVPLAPETGLFLQEFHYDTYNDKIGKDGVYKKLTWDAEEEAVQKFKLDFILPSITNKIKFDKISMKWIKDLPMHKFTQK